MASGVAAVWMPVEDMQRALKFYGETLGLSVKTEGDDWSELNANGVSIGLNAREATHGVGGGGAMLTLQPDITLYDEIVRLTDAGVEFIGEVSDNPWGRIASFKDSEGNALQLFEPPSE
ncbi:glyoxalase [Mycobacterium antarcticum]|uniref:VOC family protein n=1 Tax=unclassified Mycolicibacterium TaxID=2636767 RepID=UPI002383F645|nr:MULTISPECIES: VOC family protein [unclassified Mycolicibacterium]BDX32840.1 glyoxalase [Mycolicibacterium sp. TUM20985]GLP76023.1 glyoxalase [Mycolicibacterium sp. TUM20983]GLP83619.1 glyoxalase [Mycolicibacterium sp. TUM20984]